MTTCDCIRCTLTTHLMAADNRRLEEVINHNDPITMNVSKAKRKTHFREFIRNK